MLERIWCDNGGDENAVKKYSMESAQFPQVSPLAIPRWAKILERISV